MHVTKRVQLRDLQQILDALARFSSFNWPLFATVVDRRILKRPSWAGSTLRPVAEIEIVQFVGRRVQDSVKSWAAESIPDSGAAARR